jgi:hypothetical protein
VVRALNAPPDEFESDLECESPTASDHRTLIHNQQTESSPDQENPSDHKPICTHSWSQRMREKVEDLHSNISSQNIASIFLKQLKKNKQYKI